MPHVCSPTPTDETTRTATGSDAVLRALEAEGVEICFGMPGGAVLPLYDAIARGTSIRHVLVAHEQGAGHMAQGYARASGEVGVVFATSGPGATNLVTPIADARMDSTPLVAITGQVRQDLIGTQAFQECEITSVVRPLVKRAWLVREVADIPRVVGAAVRLARGGRPGPVLVDIPRDVQEAACEARPGAAASVGRSAQAPAAAPPGAAAASGSAAAVEPATAAAIVAEIEAASRPVLYVGGGAQGAAPELLALAEAAAIPVVSTLMGKGAFPERHGLFVGWPGMHGLKSANWALNKADLVIAAGARFDDRVTGRLDAFAPAARVVHIDVDPNGLGKLRRPDLPVTGELAAVLAATLAHGAPFPGAPARTAAWRRTIAGWTARFPLRYAPQAAGAALPPQLVMERLAAATEGRDIVWTTGVGQHQMWAMQYLRCARPRSFVTSGGHGTMGFGLPAAIGAKAARPGSQVICVDGDGSFQMTAQELVTAVRAELPVIVVILNNQRLGMVHQWQTLFYEERLAEVDLSAAMPDFEGLAKSYGAGGITVHGSEEFDEALATALAARWTTVIDVRVDPRAECYPMIPPGAAAVDQVEWTEAAR